MSLSTVGRKEETIPLKQNTASNFMNFLKNFETNSNPAIIKTEISGASISKAYTPTPTRKKTPPHLRPDKHAARTKAHKAWGLSRFLDSI
jgi:hypothetical protein